MAQRRIFTAKSEILAQQFTNLRNDYEKLLFENFVKNSVPRMPSFVGGGFKPTLSGNQVNIAPGIGFQEIVQTDGSTPIRLMLLAAQQTMSFVLPAVGQTKRALVQARSRIVNDPQQSRNIKVGASVVSRNILVSNRWSAEVAVKDNVVADANGNYVADIGWVPVAIVTLNSSGITALEDARDFYNLFDPDFFSVYGRKNVSFQRPWDGVTLVEVPFEFSDLVPKLDQVSVRRVTKETFGEATISNKYDADFSLSAPVTSAQGARPFNQMRFLGSQSAFNYLNSRSYRDSNRNLFAFLHREDTRWAGGSFGEQDIWGFDLYVSGPNRNSIRGAHNRQRGPYPGLNASAFIDDLTQAQFNAIPSSGIYIYLTPSGSWRAGSIVPAIVWNIRKSALVLRYDNLLLPTTLFSPIYKIGGDADVRYRYFMVSTNSPIISSPGRRTYLFGTGIDITSFYRLDSLTFDPQLNQLKWVLSAPRGTRTDFPSAGFVFDSVVLKKGTEKRLTKSIDNLTIALTNDTQKVYATYTYNLNSQDTLIKPSDSSHTNWNIEFERLTTRGEEIWRANKMRGGSTLSPTVDFKLEEEGLRTYVRLNGQYPFKVDDQLIFSHIIPQELIDAGSGGTPEDQDVATQVAALQASFAALQREVSANKGDIDTLENQTAASRITFYTGILFVGIRNAASRANAKNAAHLGPLAIADFNVPANRTSKEIASLLLSGAKVTYTAGVASGYYSPWIGVESNDLASGGLDVVGPGGNESDLWRPAGTASLGEKEYSFFVRISPVLNGKSLTVIFRTFE